MIYRSRNLMIYIRHVQYLNVKWDEVRRSDEIREMSGQLLVATVIRKRRRDMIKE
uniref:Uncharacterized protein n=1 Tax=Arion vulgaris TaxID=1028688 RepID=A0A0B7BCC0_9EUPU